MSDYDKTWKLVEKAMEGVPYAALWKLVQALNSQGAEHVRAAKNRVEVERGLRSEWHGQGKAFLSAAAQLSHLIREHESREAGEGDV